jgi:hypothetical protein
LHQIGACQRGHETASGCVILAGNRAASGQHNDAW